MQNKEGIVRGNVGVTHLIAPANLTQDKKIQEGNRNNKDFLLKNIDEYLDKLKPKNGPPEDDSGLFGDAKPRKKTAMEQKIEALKNTFTSNDPGIKVNGRDLKPVNPKIEKKMLE